MAARRIANILSHLRSSRSDAFLHHSPSLSDASPSSSLPLTETNHHHHHHRRRRRPSESDSVCTNSRNGDGREHQNCRDCKEIQTQAQAGATVEPASKVDSCPNPELPDEMCRIQSGASPDGVVQSEDACSSGWRWSKESSANGNFSIKGTVPVYGSFENNDGKQELVMSSVSQLLCRGGNSVDDRTADGDFARDNASEKSGGELCEGCCSNGGNNQPSVQDRAPIRSGCSHSHCVLTATRDRMSKRDGCHEKEGVFNSGRKTSVSSVKFELSTFQELCQILPEATMKENQGSKDLSERFVSAVDCAQNVCAVRLKSKGEKVSTIGDGHKRAAPLSPSSHNCVFCKIVQGQAPAFKLYEDEYCICILDINPLCYGHSLIVPKAHFPSLEATPPKVAAAMCAIVPLISKVLMDATNCDAFNMVVNSGEAAGQVVFHTHFHIVPRSNGDGLWTAESHELQQLPVNSGDTSTSEPSLSVAPVLKEWLSKSGHPGDQQAADTCE